ncbi:hypothetical protein [Alteromonas gracilis]|uniref:hypothetical protein n=1 Tax=Alteromonas gracilis TaxID=1479524 RepID=UPI0030CDC9A4
MRTKYDIILKVIELVEKNGQPLKVDNLPGLAHQASIGDFSMIYTTPFSGAEVYPGQRAYMIDIWYRGKKVFSEHYRDINNVKVKGSKKRAEWVEPFFELL